MSFNNIYELNHREVETERLSSSSCCFVMLMLANEDNRVDVLTFQLNLLLSLLKKTAWTSTKTQHRLVLLVTFHHQDQHMLCFGAGFVAGLLCFLQQG